MTDKQHFKKTTVDTMLIHLKMALLYCNIYSDVKDLTYDPEKEIVICEYYPGTLAKLQNGITYTLEINVACDSNSAMIKDVVERLDAFFRIGGKHDHIRRYKRYDDFTRFQRTI